MRDHVSAGTETVDGFRGLAILLVLVYHTWLFSWYTPALALFGIGIPVDVIARTGYLAVELFFSISGFVLFLPYARRDLAFGAPRSLRTYAYRRFIKIVPSYTLALVATAASLASLHIAIPVVPSIVEHALLLQNFFATDVGRANSVFWSLAIEAQFYIVFPVLARAFRRWPVRVAGAMVAGALAYRYGIAHCCLQDEPAYRQLPAFLDVFAAGMLAAYGVVRVRASVANVDRYRFSFTVAAGAAVAIGFALLQSANAIQYDVAGREKWILANRTAVALVSGTLLFASSFAVRAWRAVVANPVFVFFSLISYNLYLWHTLVLIWLWKHGALPAATRNVHDDDHWKVLFIASGWSLAIAISTAITYFIERPLLGTVKPQTFAFRYCAIVRRLGITRSPRATAPPETRT